MRDELNLLLSTLEGGGAPQCGVTVRGSRRSFDFSLSVPDAASLSLCAHHALPARTPLPSIIPRGPSDPRGSRVPLASLLLHTGCVRRSVRTREYRCSFEAP